MNRRGVLSFWQATWREPLTDAQVTRFMARAEVEELATMADETVRMAVRAHQRLTDEIVHARWVAGGRLATAGCGCALADADADAGVHKLTVLQGPDTRHGTSGPRSPTVAGRCSCAWETRAGSEDVVRVRWGWHVRGDEEEPLDHW